MTIILGIDFTSAPKKSKPIVLTTGVLEAKVFVIANITLIQSLEEFTLFLSNESQWIGGFDLPFSMPGDFIRSEF